MTIFSCVETPGTSGSNEEKWGVDMSKETIRQSVTKFGDDVREESGGSR